MAMDTILGGSGVLWGAEKVKINANFAKLETDADVSFSTLTLTGASGLTVPSYVRHLQVPATLAGNPSTQPTLDAVGTAAVVVMANAGGKYAYFQWEIPEDFVGGTEDITIEVDWLPFGSAVGAGETVVHKATYRSIAEGEAMTTGTAATVTGTFTDSGAGTAENLVVHTPMTLTYNHADQPLAVGDHIFVQIERDTDTFTGDTGITAFEIIYNSNAIPTTN